MNIEDVRIILERTFLVPVTESDAQIVFDRLLIVQKEALQSLKNGEISPLTFAMIIGNEIEQEPITEKSIEWAKKKIESTK